MTKPISDEILKKELTPEQYELYRQVREEMGEEKAFCCLPYLGKEYMNIAECISPVNANIKKLRLENGLTQVDLANVLGVSHKEYWRMEQTGYSINIFDLAYIAMFYNVSIDWISGFCMTQKPFIENTKIYEANMVNGYVLKEMKEAKSRGEKYEPHRYNEEGKLE